eukprot:5200824-Pleurochrysis_carterae.AAC.2
MSGRACRDEKVRPALWKDESLPECLKQNNASDGNRESRRQEPRNQISGNHYLEMYACRRQDRCGLEQPPAAPARSPRRPRRRASSVRGAARTDAVRARAPSRAPRRPQIRSRCSSDAACVATGLREKNAGSPSIRIRTKRVREQHIAETEGDVGVKRGGQAGRWRVRACVRVRVLAFAPLHVRMCALTLVHVRVCAHIRARARVRVRACGSFCAHADMRVVPVVSVCERVPSSARAFVRRFRAEPLFKEFERIRKCTCVCAEVRISVRTRSL